MQMHDTLLQLASGWVVIKYGGMISVVMPDIVRPVD